MNELRRLRERLGLTFEQVAKSVHVTSRSWRRYEEGTRPLSATVMHLFLLRHRRDITNKYSDATTDEIMKDFGFEP